MAGNEEESDDDEIDQTKPSKSRKVGGHGSLNDGR